MTTSKVYVWKNDQRKWEVGVIVPLIDGEAMVISKHTADTHAGAFQWIQENYVTEAP